MNLFERLKDEHKAKLKKQNISFPLVVEQVTEELEAKTKVNQLSYGVVMSLHTLLNNYGSPYELFNEL